MTEDNVELCGYEKDDGTPCKLTASRSDGRCHHHTETEDTSNNNRPSLLESDPEIQDAIVTAIENGATKTQAAQSVGIHRHTILNWYDKGEEQADLPPEERDHFFDFFAACARAQARDKDWLRERMRENGGDDWRQQAWELERKYPKEYREKTSAELEHSGEVDGKQTVEMTVNLDDQDFAFLDQTFDRGTDDATTVE